MDSIKAIVTRILRAEPESGSVFAAVLYETSAGLTTAKVGGYARWLRPGDCFLAHGEWRSTSFRGKAEETFRAVHVRPALPETRAGIERFLLGVFSEAAHGLSAKAIGALLDKHGTGLLAAVMANPDILAAASAGPAFHPAILAEWSARTQGSKAAALLQNSGIRPDVVETIIDHLPVERPLEYLHTNPWKVARIEDVGFDNADLVGIHLGLSRRDHRRLTEAVVGVLRERAAAGSTATDVPTMLERLSRKSRIDHDMLMSFLRAATWSNNQDLALFESDSGIVAGLWPLYWADVAISNHVRAVLARPRRRELSDCQRHAERIFAQPEFARLDDIQRQAVMMAAAEPLAIITGGPGTGKSSIMKAVAAMGDAMDAGRMLFLAPTGKAAKQLEETTGRRTATVHRALQAAPGADGTVFGVNEHNRLPRGSVVIVDEASMLNSETASALMRAIPDDGRLVLVGDQDQLPSVNAGAVLEDLLAAGSETLPAVPKVALKRVYRQAEDSAIAKGAALIRQGIIPEMTADNRGGVSFIDVDETMLGDAVERMVCDELVREGWDPVRDVAVLAPMAPGPGGTMDINARLSARLNRAANAALPGVAKGPRDRRGTPLPGSATGSC